MTRNTGYHFSQISDKKTHKARSVDNTEIQKKTKNTKISPPKKKKKKNNKIIYQGKGENIEQKKRENNTYQNSFSPPQIPKTQRI